MKLFRSFFGSKNERELKRYWPIVEKVAEYEQQFKGLSDEQLRLKTTEFKSRLQKGESLDELLSEAFAVVREGSRRVLGMRHFDVQIIGGIVLHEGRIAEMKTGEGKTLCATLPVYLNALTGKGVHVVTVNDYLARRDAQWMGQLYSFLGLSTGVVVNGMEAAERAQAYRADITYGQNNEFGFDYLRDNMKLELSEMLQRGHIYAIVDEVDSILVDEARTPLILSGPAENSTKTYEVADIAVRKLRAETDYTVDLKSKQVTLTEDGVAHAEKLLGVENLYDPRNIEAVHHITQALKAHVIMKRDVDYVVRNDEVIIVDEFTGRLMAGRRWSDGLHQAVEAKERVTVARENQTLATVTFQNYFRMYGKLAGMTGTADTEAVEFKKIYNLDVVIIPTNMPLLRKDFPDVVFATERGKFRAVCDEIEKLCEVGQPVLVGTGSIAKSELLSDELKKRDVPHHVLNAKQHEREAEIVAQAGRLKAVTISTNMAGRGTDILLGGNPEVLVATSGIQPDSPEYEATLEHFREICRDERKKVLEVGGLHILGTERHESRRIDNQLRGRSGRQGDPGSSRFYVSLEDDLMRRFGGERVQAIMTRMGLQEDDAIEGALVGRAIENAQKKVEGLHFDQRKHVLEYDDVLTKQREVIYGLRSRVLRGEEVEKEVLEMIPDIIEDFILLRANEKEPVISWDVEGMLREYSRMFGEELPVAQLIARKEEAGKELAQEIFEFLRDSALARYEQRKSRFGVERLVKLERIVYLQSIDHYWKEHLANIDHLKEGIGLRGYAQKNPLHEYQREAFELFSAMMFAVKGNVLQNVFIPELPSEEELRQIEEHEREVQRRREESVQSVHENVLESDRAESERAGVNRRRRRMLEQREATFKPTAQDYAPFQGSGVPVKAKKEQQRKKNKAAKKARKKNK